ncbi:MAG: type VI secretion system baseplate subunit TssF [Bryobacteraceae bacterium]
MPDELVGYYERELGFLRQMGAEFSKKHGKIAQRLGLEPDRCEDPHVERLLEGFAFLAARIHRKLDDELPELTESLFNILYPHYVRPIPAMSIVEFHADPEQGKLTTGFRIAKDSMLYSRPVQGIPCKFRTGFDTTLWPLQVSAARWTSPDRLPTPVKAPQAVAACQVELTCSPDVRFEALALTSLRFYLSGEPTLVSTLYELLFNNRLQILVRDPAKGARAPLIPLPITALQPVGFREEESLLPFPRRSFIGYRLLQEYFAFPEKFFFVELGELHQLAAAGFAESAEIIFLISPFERADRHQILEMGVSAQTFRLNCAPVVNLFTQTAEPIRMDETRTDYPVVPDARRRRGMEVFSIDQVLSSSSGAEEITYFEPYYSLRHSNEGSPQRAFWRATRRELDFDDRADLSISFLDLSGQGIRPDVDTLTVRCTCTNRDLPSTLPFGQASGDFELEGASIVKRVVTLHKFTPSYRLPPGRELLWRLLSHLSLNYLSLVEEGQGALQEILRLYNFSGSSQADRQINGIKKLSSRRHFGRVTSEHGIHFVRGTRVEMELDEDQFVGGGVYLFAQVIEQFLGLYVSMNSFSQLEARTQQRKGVLKEWPPRAGHRILL